MKWLIAKSNKDCKNDCLVQIEVSNNNTEIRNEIFDINNATYHTDSIKIVLIININTKEKINSAYILDNNTQINIGEEIKYDNSILKGDCNDKGFEYYLTVLRAMNEFTINKTIYLYTGEKFCNISKIDVSKFKHVNIKI
jgi:hypothetical protein